MFDPSKPDYVPLWQRVATGTGEGSTKAQDILKSVNVDKETSISEAMGDMQDMIQHRRALNAEMFEDVDRARTHIANTMSTLGPEMTKELAREIITRQVELDTLKIQEKLNCWRDIANLKRELREHMRELRDEQQKSTLFSDLMD